MGAYCLRAFIRHHTAHVGEIMQVLWSDYYGAAIFGDGQEIACIPHTGCWLEIVGTAETSHRKVNLLLPGDVLRYTRSFLLGDRFELPGGPRVGLRRLVGFRLQLVPAPMLPMLVEEELVDQMARDLAACVAGVSETLPSNVSERMSGLTERMTGSLNTATGGRE